MIELTQRCVIENTIVKPSETIPNKLMRYMVVGKTAFIDFFHPAWYGKENLELAEYAKEVFWGVMHEHKK